MYVRMYTVLWTQKQANDEAGLQYIHVFVAQGCICSPMIVLTVVLMQHHAHPLMDFA